MIRRNVAFLGTVVVVVSAVVNVAHTASHAGQHLLSLPGWQLAYIAIVIYAAPLVAASLLWTRYRFAGAWLLTASMAGSFAFGFLYHFVIPGPDMTCPENRYGRIRWEDRKPGTSPLIGRRTYDRFGANPGS